MGVWEVEGYVSQMAGSLDILTFHNILQEEVEKPALAYSVVFVKVGFEVFYISGFNLFHVSVRLLP